MRTVRDLGLIDRIDLCLPQTQCARCGYAACYPYAEAIARGEAKINRCPPGGEVTIRALSSLLAVPAEPLDPEVSGPTTRLLSRIVESLCIGCTLCLQACPVDAIVGARKQMHTVLTQACTGCGLCVPPCPTSCIELIAHPSPAAGPWPDYSLEESGRARRAWRARQERQAQKAGSPKRITLAEKPDRDTIRAEIQAAVARVRNRRAETTVPLQSRTHPLK